MTTAKGMLHFSQQPNAREPKAERESLNRFSIPQTGEQRLGTLSGQSLLNLPAVQSVHCQRNRSQCAICRIWSNSRSTDTPRLMSAKSSMRGASSLRTKRRWRLLGGLCRLLPLNRNYTLTANCSTTLTEVLHWL